MEDEFVKEQKTEGTAKERHRFKLIDYLANIENEWPGRSSLGPIVLGITDRALRKHFSPAELNDIEKEALDERRKRYSVYLAEADKVLVKKVREGDTQAIKLLYQKIEGWKEGKTLEHSGLNPVKVEVTFADGKSSDPEET